jgi:hypothetical protein
MKTILKISAVAAIIITGFEVNLQAQLKPTIAVLNIETKGLVIDAQSMADVVRLELEKTKVYNVIDKHDMEDMIAENKIDISKCFGKTCLLEAAKAIKVDKILSGSAERIGEKIIITLRVLDTKMNELEKIDVMEYLNLPEIQNMVMISVHNIVGLENDPDILNLLVNYNVPVTTPRTKINLSGPRMGCSYVTDPASKRLTSPKSKGGYDMFPITSQFGFQYEVQYLSAGNFQALVEFIGLIGGLESGRFVPSLSLLNGFRFNKGGIEFGFGPVFEMVKKADGFYDSQAIIGEKNEWHLKNEWNSEQYGPVTDYYPVVERIDSRGEFVLSTGLVLAIGKTFHSGYLNIPVNLYFIPNKQGSAVGLSFGFNINKNNKNRR